MTLMSDLWPTDWTWREEPKKYNKRQLFQSLGPLYRRSFDIFAREIRDSRRQYSCERKTYCPFRGTLENGEQGAAQFNVQLELQSFGHCAERSRMSHAIHYPLTIVYPNITLLCQNDLLFLRRSHSSRTPL